MKTWISITRTEKAMQRRMSKDGDIESLSMQAKRQVFIQIKY